jgi:hypothetical protein
MNELEDLVTGAEIGRRLGISRERVRQLAVADEFPTSLGALGASRIWRWRDVKAWSETRQTAHVTAHDDPDHA